MGLTQVTPPAIEPMALDDAKKYLRVDTADDDVLIKTLITAAREWVERYTGQALITQTWDYWLDHFPHETRRGGEPWWDGVKEGPFSMVHPYADEIELPFF